MAAGLFYVYTEPGTVDEAEFHDWYDHEHGPARLTVPGVGGAYRYRALDDQKPAWLALYELDGPDVIDSPEYKALGANASDRDKSVAAGLATLDRRVYEQISEDGSPVGRPAPVILAVAMSVPAGERGRPGRLVHRGAHPDAAQGARAGGGSAGSGSSARMDAPGPDFLSVHELAGPRSWRTPATARRSARRGATGWWPRRRGGNDGCSACATLSSS